jgi:ribosomal protein S14
MRDEMTYQPLITVTDSKGRKVESCPKCGAQDVVVVYSASGPVTMYYDLVATTKPIDNSHMYEEVRLKGGKTARCADCGQKLGKVEDRD